LASTHPYIPRISLVFDFDKTLASDTIDAMCAAWGMSREEWEEQYHAPLGDNWDGILKRSHALIACGRDRDDPLTENFFDRAAEHIELYDGVLDLKKHLSEVGKQIVPDIEVELVVLSSGYIDIVERTRVNDVFDRSWAGEFHFADGKAVCLKRMIAHPTKARYLEAHAKGLDIGAANSPRVDDPDFDEMDMHVPLDQMVYIGDGLSDLEAFGFLTNNGGQAIAIDESARFDHADQQTADERVDNLASPTYAEGSELLESLRHAARSAASRAALRKQSQGK
jgi:phosphoglycolate phosphatase-like HAD superfamily hydrolase